ncbi:MAG TPA: hypothetical protein VFG12_04055, partial [Rhodopila sp.]|nr:hypothetical protein [Rhodopila sp.]
ILAAPRTGGLLLQLPLGLAGAAIAFSSGWAGVAAVRLVGIAVLGRPRTPRGAGAQDGPASSRMLLLGLAALSVLLGLLPETILWLLADPAIRGLTGDHSGVAWGVSAAAAPGYLAFPVLALLALATLGTIAATRWRPKAAKVTGAWTSGMAPPAGLPFGEPAAQSAGAGFLPSWPRFPLPRLHLPPSLPHLRPPSAAFGLWLLLAAFAAALLALGVVG